MSAIGKLIENNQKMVELLKEYKESTEYEKSEYDVVDLSMPGKAYFQLYQVSDNTMVKEGSAKALCTWLQRRHIAPEKVYCGELINYK